MRIVLQAVATSLLLTGIVGVFMTAGTNLVSPTLFLLSFLTYIAGMFFRDV